jgi:hypothetical protein
VHEPVHLDPGRRLLAALLVLEGHQLQRLLVCTRTQGQTSASPHQARTRRAAQQCMLSRLLHCGFQATNPILWAVIRSRGMAPGLTCSSSSCCFRARVLSSLRLSASRRSRLWHKWQVEVRHAGRPSHALHNEYGTSGCPSKRSRGAFFPSIYQIIFRTPDISGSHSVTCRKSGAPQ